MQSRIETVIAGIKTGVLELLRQLHPTPAVGGTPRDEALAFIAAHEAGERGHWAGPVGWVGADGDGEWMIGIRSAELDPEEATLRLRAGEPRSHAKDQNPDGGRSSRDRAARRLRSRERDVRYARGKGIQVLGLHAAQERMSGQRRRCRLGHGYRPQLLA